MNGRNYFTTGKWKLQKAIKLSLMMYDVFLKKDKGMLDIQFASPDVFINFAIDLIVWKIFEQQF